MSSAEVFTPVDVARRGYKILVILYDQSGVRSSVSAESFLSSCYCFTNKKDHVYDMAMSDITKKHHGNTIAYNIQQSISPIIIDNVTDLPSAKLLCEFAVKHGYLIDIIQSKNASLPTKTREDLFIDFDLLYEQEIPQLRRYPSIPSHLKSQDDTIIKGVIQRRYDPWILKNPKEPIKKNVNQEKQEKQKPLPDDTTDETPLVSPERAKQTLDPSEEDKLYREAMSSVKNLITSTANPSNAKTSAQMLKNDGEAANTTKEADKSMQTNKQETLQAITKTIQEDINKRFEENTKSMSKTMENSFAEMNDNNKTRSESFSKRLEQQFDTFKKATQNNISKTLEDNNKAIGKKMDDFLIEIKKFIQTEAESVYKRFHEQFTIQVAASKQLISEDEGEVVDDKAKKSTDKPPNKKNDSQGAKKRQPQTQTAASQEIQVDNTAYEQIIPYITEGFKVMILMRGLPGSGKTYLANKILKDSLGNVNPSEFIFDPLEQFMRNGRFKDGDSNAAHTLNKRKCFEAVTRGVSPVIVDSTNLQIEDMRVYCLMAIENGYMIETIEVNTAWASNAATLAKKNTLRLDKKQIQMLQECYQRNVSSSYLLKELGVNHKQSLPQFRTYPPFFKPQDSTSEVVKKPAVVMQDYVHKFDMKYGEKADQTLIDVSDTKETISASKEIKNENEDVINDMRKQIAEQNGVIQQLLKFMPMVQMNQNTPANVSVMQQNKAQDLSEYGYNQGQQNRNYQSTHGFQENFDPYSTNQPSYENPNAGNMTENYQTSSEGLWAFKDDNVRRGNPDQSKENWGFK